jgi:aerobic-type carbon monoxide dehydrogenase small subunit (CoxS/CutS family)
LNLTLSINGQPTEVRSDGERSLLEVLREDLGLTGTKYGCGEGECRACTVLLDGRAVPSCRTSISSVQGKKITTIEGLAGKDGLADIQQAFLTAEAMQCGYCVPGMILTAKALLDDHPRPSKAEIVEALNGNLCRCCGYQRIVEAVQRAADGRSSRDTASERQA